MEGNLYIYFYEWVFACCGFIGPKSLVRNHFYKCHIFRSIPSNDLKRLTDLLEGDIIIRYWSVLYYTVLYCTILYCTVLYCTVLYCTVLYCTVLYCTVLYCTVLVCTVLLYYTVLYCTVLYCTVLYCTVLYCTVLYWSVHVFTTLTDYCVNFIRSIHDVKATDLGTKRISLCILVTLSFLSLPSLSLSLSLSPSIGPDSVRFKAEVNFDGREVTRLHLQKLDLERILKVCTDERR